MTLKQMETLGSVLNSKPSAPKKAEQAKFGSKSSLTQNEKRFTSSKLESKSTIKPADNEPNVPDDFVNQKQPQPSAVTLFSRGGRKIVSKSSRPSGEKVPRPVSSTSPVAKQFKRQVLAQQAQN